MSKILDYLNHLDKDANARDAHVADPAGSMTNFGLTEDEQGAILSGDKQQIANAAGIQVQDLAVIHLPNTDVTY